MTTLSGTMTGADEGLGHRSAQEGHATCLMGSL
jgi:hypothetical protein